MDEPPERGKEYTAITILELESLRKENRVAADCLKYMKLKVERLQKRIKALDNLRQLVIDGDVTLVSGNYYTLTYFDGTKETEFDGDTLEEAIEAARETYNEYGNEQGEFER
jgi:hypothetical protein